MNWLKFAEVLDSLRVIPRLLMLAVYSFTAIYVFDVTREFFEVIRLPGVTDWKLTAFAGFAGLTIPALAGLAIGLTKAYFNSGRTWKKETDDQ